jgi:mono/diheme cytochrome c family protein
MNPIGHIRRFAAAVAGLACALVAFAATAPAAFAVPPPGGSAGPHLPPGHIVGPVYKAPVHTVTHTVVVGGMPGWQITLIAVAAALLAATVAVLADRSRAAHRKTITAAA